MLIKQATLLKVEHDRKGTFTGIAMEDFDTENVEFYPIALAQQEEINGVKTPGKWQQGDIIPCRNTLCTLEVVDA